VVRKEPPGYETLALSSLVMRRSGSGSSTRSPSPMSRRTSEWTTRRTDHPRRRAAL